MTRTQEPVKVLVPSNGNKIAAELARQLNSEANIQLEHSDEPDMLNYDVYVVLLKDGSIVEGIRKHSPNASVFVILCTNETRLLKKLLSLRVDGVIDEEDPQYQPVVNCIQQRAQSMNGFDAVYMKLEMLKKMQLHC